MIRAPVIILLVLHMKKQRTPEACETWPLTKNTTHLQLPLLEDLPSPETQATQPTKAEENIHKKNLIRRIETNMKQYTLKWSDEMAILYFAMTLKTKANEWFFVLKRYTEQKFSAFQNKFLDKY